MALPSIIERNNSSSSITGTDVPNVQETSHRGSRRHRHVNKQRQPRGNGTDVHHLPVPVMPQNACQSDIVKQRSVEFAGRFAL